MSTEIPKSSELTQVCRYCFSEIHPDASICATCGSNQTAWKYILDISSNLVGLLGLSIAFAALAFSWYQFDDAADDAASRLEHQYEIILTLETEKTIWCMTPEMCTKHDGYIKSEINTFRQSLENERTKLEPEIYKSWIRRLETRQVLERHQALDLRQRK